ncbi:DUF421 domain-containing protein [Fredinandcohnia sp. 179-A 10B2 NHS]|uniref:DUF421 domain-containing protein n=1 Tax=Fredinandcohnia sp. 179-A 10B2 NHS TaxID=3235176 RepID=UPI00399F6CA0
MLEHLKDILLILGRIVTMIPLLLVMTIFMGKRAIGELPIFDFLIVIILGAVVGADIADPNIHHLPTAAAIVGIGLLQRFVANWKLSNRSFGRLITFEPTVVIQDGKFLYENVRKIRYSIDNILQMLREKGVFDIKDVETAIIEANGSLSVLKKTSKSTVTLEDLNLSKSNAMISFPVIVEGTIYSNVLEHFNHDKIWLQQQMQNMGIIDLQDVFFASINRDSELHISLKDDQNTLVVPPIKH